MRICIDLTALADNLSGIERYAACLTLEMLKHENDYFILLFKDNVHEIFKPHVNKKNINCVVILRCNKLIFNQIRLPLIIHKIKADWYLFMAFPVPILSFKRNMVSTIHDICCWDCPETMNGLSNWYFHISHRVALTKCKAIITISNFSKKRIHEKLKYPNDKIWLVYCGIDHKKFTVHSDRIAIVREKYILPSEYILSLSTLEPRKNLPLLIRAYEDLIEQGENLPELVLAGRKGWKMDKFLDSITPEVKKRIIFTGFIDDKDIPELYAMAKFFIFPSMYEGFGMPPLEAMSCGTPVVTSDSSSLPEVLGNTTVYFKNNNLDDLKKKIIEMNKMTQNARNTLSVSGIKQSRKYNWTKEAEKLYGFLVSNNGRKRFSQT